MGSSRSYTTSRPYYIQLLSAAYYATWSIKIEMLLIRSKFWNVVDGMDVALLEFITIQGKIASLTFTRLFSNILQQNSISYSKDGPSKISAFYVKGNFMKSYSSKPNRLLKPLLTRTTSFIRLPITLFQDPIYPKNLSFVICHYCGISGHKAPDCHKKRKDQTSSSKPHVNLFRILVFCYLYSFNSFYFIIP